MIKKQVVLPDFPSGPVYPALLIPGIPVCRSISENCQDMVVDILKGETVTLLIEPAYLVLILIANEIRGKDDREYLIKILLTGIGSRGLMKDISRASQLYPRFKRPDLLRTYHLKPPV